MQSSLLLNFARTTFLRGMLPLGARRAQQFLRAGLPDAFRPALDFLFTRRLAPEDARVSERVEALRDALARSGQVLMGMANDGSTAPRASQYIAHYASVTREWGTFLYLCGKGVRAESILELGSSAGISGSYLCATPTCREFISIERSPSLAAVAQTHVQQIFPRAQIVIGAIDDVLENVLTRFANGVQLCYIDANHFYEPTLHYFQTIAPFLKKGALMVFDDIHWSKGMWDAWQVLRAQQGFSHTMDVGRFGLCVWQGGAVQPQQFNLAKYAGWVWNYAPR